MIRVEEILYRVNREAASLYVKDMYDEMEKMQDVSSLISASNG